jgi:hypothetical protein
MLDHTDQGETTLGLGSRGPKGPTFETRSDFFDHGIGDYEAQKDAAQNRGIASRNTRAF